MKRNLTILALLAAAVISSALANALTVTITRARNADAIVVTLSDSKTDAGNSARVVAAGAKGGIALLFCDLPAGIYTAVVLARE